MTLVKAARCVLVCVLGTAAVSAGAAIIPVRQLELAGQATVTASPWDIGHKDNLFDGDWFNLYRTDAWSNPAVITVEFATPQATAAARGKLTSTCCYTWQLEAADTLSDLEKGIGSYLLVFGPLDVPGDDSTLRATWHDAPVTRRIYRFTVERLHGDNHVHINELELQSPEPVTQVQLNGQTVTLNTLLVTPADAELAVGATQPYVATGSFYHGPPVYDLTGYVAWSSSVPQVASITSGGVATGLAPGSTQIAATLGVVQGATPLTVRAYRPVDLNVGFIHRTPEYTRFHVNHDGDQHIDPAYLHEQKWPAPGELVTYTAHIFNKGDADAGSFEYRWYFDGHLVASGTVAALPAGGQTTVVLQRAWPADTVQLIELPGGAQVLQPQQLERAIGNHRVRCEVDPDHLVAEGCERNNVVEDYINALAFWIYMDESTYALFNQKQNFLESFSAEDWGQMQLLGLQRRFWASGCPQKIRLDMVAVYPDGALSPYTTHEPHGSESWWTDGRWGFQYQEYHEALVERYAKINFNVIMHEWGHQMGLIDVYQYDIATDQCDITHNGQPVAGGPLMPLVSPWNVWYGNYRVLHRRQVAIDASGRDLMGWPEKHFLGSGSAAGMNRNLGLRRGFFGDYLGAIPQGDIKLHVQHHNGAAVAGCPIRVFQREAGNFVPDNPKFAGTTDADGDWTFPSQTLPGWYGGVNVNNPWSSIDGPWVRNTPHPLGVNAVLIVELSFDGRTEYHFVEVDEVNVAFAAGAIDDCTLVLTTYESRKSDHLPTISFNGAPQDVWLTEGETFTATITASDYDEDPVTLRQTPLYHTTFDPATGQFTFAPDSLQVSEHASGSEELYVDFVADDGQFTSVKRMTFHVVDLPGVAQIDREPLARLGDLNCDGALDFRDINPFVLALSNPAAYKQQRPDCHILNADISGDGVVDFRDINRFVALFAAE